MSELRGPGLTGLLVSRHEVANGETGVTDGIETSLVLVVPFRLECPIRLYQETGSDIVGRIRPLALDEMDLIVFGVVVERDELHDPAIGDVECEDTAALNQDSVAGCRNGGQA